MTAGLDEVAVVVGTERLEQAFGEELRDRMNPTRSPSPKRYRVQVAIQEFNIPLFVAPDGTYGRGNIRFTANFRLTRMEDGALIDTGSVTRMSSYAASETNAIYASHVAQQDARQRGIVELANDIALRVANRLNDASLQPIAERQVIEADPIVDLETQEDLNTLRNDQ